MKKLIELDAALDALREVIVPAEDIGFGDESTDGYNDGINMAVTVVSGLPTVDAVPVVRCKDCIRFRPDDDVWGWCTVSGKMRCKDYCSYGVREDGEQHG